MEAGGRSNKTLARVIYALAGWLAGVRRRLRAAPLAFGKRSEGLAARYLARRGYRILARNFRAAGAEIDLVALEGDTLVFVEVKARRSGRAGAPEAAVDGRKRHRLRRAAEIYVARHHAGARPVRFDVVAVSAQGRQQKFELLRNAF